MTNNMGPTDCLTWYNIVYWMWYSSFAIYLPIVILVEQASISCIRPAFQVSGIACEPGVAECYIFADSKIAGSRVPRCGRCLTDVWQMHWLGIWIIPSFRTRTTTALLPMRICLVFHLSCLACTKGGAWAWLVLCIHAHSAAISPASHTLWSRCRESISISREEEDWWRKRKNDVSLYQSGVGEECAYSCCSEGLTCNPYNPSVWHPGTRKEHPFFTVHVAIMNGKRGKSMLDPINWYINESVAIAYN
jgi:hypothetical protein